MRTILFRGKRIDNGAWVEGDLLQWKSKGKAAITPQNGDEWSNPYDFEVIPETVGQFTGLLDKNGKKIFEGDKISFEEKHDIFGWILDFSTVRWNGLEWSINHSYRNLEIYGNIHDK